MRTISTLVLGVWFIIAGLSCCKTSEPVMSEPEPEVAPTFHLKEIADFPESINECSGIVEYKGQYYAMNDGPNQTSIIQFDPNNAEVINTVDIEGVSCQDWEAIAYDGNRFVIADIGNNSGKRLELLLYVVDPTNWSCTDTLSFIWPDFEKPASSFFHNWDCEAMLLNGDEVLFFTKNRNDFYTNMYHLDLNTREIVKGKTLEINRLVTDAAWAPNGDIILIAYTFLPSSFSMSAFIIDVEGVQYTVAQDIPLNLKAQGEAILHMKDNKYLLGSESEDEQIGKLFELDLSEYFK